MDKVIKWAKGSRFRRLLAGQLLVWERMNHRFAPRLVWSIWLPALPAHRTRPMEFRTTLQTIRCHFLHEHRLVDRRAEHGTWGLPVWPGLPEQRGPTNRSVRCCPVTACEPRGIIEPKCSFVKDH